MFLPRYHVWTRWSPHQHAGGAHTISSAGNDDEQSSVWRPDPRLTQLGLRALLPHAGTHNDSSITDTAAAVPSSAQKVPWTAYKRFRWQLGVAEGDSEIPVAPPFPFSSTLTVWREFRLARGVTWVRSSWREHTLMVWYASD